MKQYKFLSTVLLLAAMVAWSSCSNEDESLPIPSGTGGLVINVYDAGMENVDSSVSRAVTDLNYNTTFEIGDCIGLFAVKDNSILSDINNLKVEYTKEGWRPVTELQYDGILKEATYYAYYPYVQGLNISSVESDFFATLVSGWDLKTDQSTKVNYTASDLMTSSGSTVVKSDKGEFMIQLNMSHRMSLAVVSLPGTEYKFTNPELQGVSYAVKPSGDVAFYRGTIENSNLIKPYRAGDGTYRMVVKPGESPDIVGVIGNTKYEIKKSIATGKYKRFMVDGGSQVKEYELKVGDYYCADGNLVSREAADIPDDCIGIVYYVGNPQPSILYKDNETLGAEEAKDALKRDYPNCVHGLVYAVKRANPTVSRFTSSSKFDYTGTFQGNAELSAAYLWGQESKAPTYNCILGYNNTEVLRVIENAVDMFTNLDSHVNAFPAPTISSGWYLPSLEEMRVIFENNDIINALLANISGESLWVSEDGYDVSNAAYLGYWTSTCRAKGYMYGSHNNNGVFAPRDGKSTKDGRGYFRFSLAF